MNDKSLESRARRLSRNLVQRFSIRGPVILFSIILVLIITLTVLWNVVLVQDYNRLKEFAGAETFHWSIIIIGSVLFLASIVLTCILIVQLISNLRWSQRQANFIASVSHELNSPLSSIKLFAQTLRRDGVGDADRRNFVDKILVDVDRLAHLVSNILRAAEVDHKGGEIPIVTEPVDLMEFLDEYVEAAAMSRGGRVELQLVASDPVRVDLDRFSFHQVLDNLVDNSVRYTDTTPAKVEIRLTKGRQRANIEVVDRGIGVSKDELDRLFDRFYRIEQDVPETGRRGVGIGLSVVRSIVQSHGGSVSAHSAGRGQGMTVRIRLPLAGSRPADD